MLPVYKSSKKGFVLPLSILLGVLILGLAYLSYKISRGNLDFTIHYSTRERAFHYARFVSKSLEISLEDAVQWSNHTQAKYLPKIDKCPKEILPFLEFLEEIKKNPFQNVKKTLSLPAHVNLPLQKKDELKFEISLKVLGETTFYEEEQGIIPDKTERMLQLGVEVKAILNGYSSTHTKLQEFRLCSVQPWFLSKFGLFLKHKEEFQFQSVSESFDTKILDLTPIIYHGGNDAANSGFSSESELVDFLENQGWVYLGGTGPQALHLGPGSGYLSQASSLTPSSSMLVNMRNLDGVDTILNDDSDLVYLFTHVGLASELAKDKFGKVLELIPPEELEFSSRLRLFGSQAFPVPTMVFGNVQRKYALLKGIYRESEDLVRYFPYLDGSDYASLTWPGGIEGAAVEVLKDHFKSLNSSNPYEAYKGKMSLIEIEDFNAGNLDYLVSQSKRLAYQPGQNFPAVKNLLSNSQEVLAYEVQDSRNYTMLSNDSRILFQNLDLERLLEIPGQEALVSFRYETLAELIKDRKTKEGIYLAGYFHVKEKCNFNQSLQIAAGGGGVIICQSGISINSPIQVDNRELVTLISGGDLNYKIDTKQRIGLVALDGTIQLGSKFEIHGFLAAKFLKFAPAQGTSQQSIWYDSQWDSTRLEKRSSTYKFLGSGQWISYVH